MPQNVKTETPTERKFVEETMHVFRGANALSSVQAEQGIAQEDEGREVVLFDAV